MLNERADQLCPLFSVALIESSHWRVTKAADEDTALTLIAVASEDPANWQEIAAYWPRYHTPSVSEFADGLPLVIFDEVTARQAMQGNDRWLVIDLVRKRISTGKAFERIGRDQVFNMDSCEDSPQPWPLSIHLPPWWELREQTQFQTIDDPRDTPMERPRCHRNILFGRPLIEDLARRMIATTQSQEWFRSGAATSPSLRHPFTIAIHRDWLMSPRADLAGKTPRDMLHQGRVWIDRLVDAQRLWFEASGKVIAAPTDVDDFEQTPMGLDEICIYFDLCRALIRAGWDWCVAQQKNGVLIESDAIPMLIESLTQSKAEWLNAPLHEGSSPTFILECNRRRIPRGGGVTIDGMTRREPTTHIADCHCPICQMMADGIFGVAFDAFDGHHLELDGEFAFSIWESRKEWEQNQSIYDEFEQGNQPEADDDDSFDEEGDAFSSVWSGRVCDDPIPGDVGNQLKLAFLLTEIISVLESSDASLDEIGELLSYFRQFRLARQDKRVKSARRLTQFLDRVASKHPKLVSRVADFQSRVDETRQST